MLYHARYILDGTDFLEDAYLEVEDGHVLGIHPSGSYKAREEEVVELGDVALVPGQVNAHSHAFQRAIRGRTEYLVGDRLEDDFWSWREKMYRAALSFDPDEVEAVARLAFLEMAMAGVTTVGEFHYLHHQPDGEPYEDPNELAHRVIKAARDVGLRINLLRVAYHRAGYEKADDPMQRRFVEPDVETYLDRFDQLSEAHAQKPDVSVGLAPHSIRAVPDTWLEAIRDAGEERDVPIHIHASEQRGELDESQDEYGKNPIEVFDDLGLLSDRLTIVHGTHVSDAEMDLMARHRPTICACPTTERNLGDGFLPARRYVENDVPICLGSDSHTVIDPWEEMRLVEYHERLRFEKRNVLAEPLETEEFSADSHLQTAAHVWPMGSDFGARALQLNAGNFTPGKAADFVTLDLNHLSLAGADSETLLSDVVLSMSADAVRDVYVGGQQIIEDRDHPQRQEIVEDFADVVAEL